MILEEKYVLSNGVEIPKLGLGTWFISDKDVVKAVKEAAKIGYRYIDTAQAYENERGVGDGIRAIGVKREDMIVTTKLAEKYSVSTYSDSKLHDVMLCKAAARKWPDVYSNAVDPGWVPTKMGGRGAPDNLQKGYETQVWLAVSNDERVKVTGKYFYHQKERECNLEADDIKLQERFLEVCKDITGISFQ
jgi:NAD(P)-dependent dehydrogenase (short-subunit alcohol dehydrogenase family)